MGTARGWLGACCCAALVGCGSTGGANLTDRDGQADGDRGADVISVRFDGAVVRAFDADDRVEATCGDELEVTLTTDDNVEVLVVTPVELTADDLGDTESVSGPVDVVWRTDDGSVSGSGTYVEAFNPPPSARSEVEVTAGFDTDGGPVEVFAFIGRSDPCLTRDDQLPEDFRSR